jgi:hypothetical protein
LNEVGPMVVLPLDGVSDETVEEFKIKLTDLLPGLTEVDLISRNILGSTSSPYKKYLYYLGLCFKHFSFGFSNNGIQIRWDLLGETFNAKFDLHRKETSLVPYDSVIVHDIPYHPNSQFTPFTCFDQDVQPGRKYIYYVEGKFNTVYRGETITITQLSHEFDVIASLKISKGRLMSLPSPNPFRDDMWISINVPASYREAGSSDVSPAVPGGRTTQRTAVEEPVPTWVKVKIFDAAGRKIKDLYEDRIYETIRTISWDGTNNNLERLPTGIYFLKVEAGPFTQTEKVMIVR